MEIFRLDDAFQVKAVFPVLLHLHAAALPHGGGEAELVVGEQDLEGVDPVAEGLIQLLQQLVQTIAGLGADPGPFIIDTAFLPLLISLRLPGLQSYRLPE